MNISGAPQIFLGDGILSGYYVQHLSAGLKPALFELSSPTYNVFNFVPPYDAILPAPPTGYGLFAAVGRRVKAVSDIQSNRSGKFYYYQDNDLYGVCHGYGRDEFTHYSGYNFYQAFYPAGYFAPPYGENLSIFLANQNGTDNLQNGACASLSYTEYNEQFGIISRGASDIGIETNFITPDAYAPIFSPRGVCPSDAIVANYYEEWQFRQIQGTTVSIGGGTFYNHDAVPTSLDGYRLRADNGRYATTGSDPNRAVAYTGGRPVPSYNPSGGQVTDLNNTLCVATIMETETVVGKSTNGIQLIEAPDLITATSASSSADQVFVNQGLDTHFNYWHFLYRENADTLPFSNANVFNPNNNQGVYHKGLSEDTELFDATLSSEDYYWQNRQCPDTVDFLPWTFGASIYACPSKHFDIPYYAATKKFGFYGTRFLATCNALNTIYPWNGVNYAIELPSGTSYPLDKGQLEPDDLDVDGWWSFGYFDNLLKTAAAEERYTNMYALNQAFFIWANLPFITPSYQYQQLSLVSGFLPAFSAMVNQFSNIYSGGLSSFISGEPQIIVQAGLAGSSNVVDNSQFSNVLFTNDVYNTFINQIRQFMPNTGMILWNQIEKDYSYYVTSGAGVVNEPFYSGIVSGRERRLLTRYMENVVQGNPIDLFPLNHIYFSFDSGKDMLEHTGWGRSLAPLAKNHLPEVNRRFFEGAYGKGNAISGLTQALNQLTFSDTTSFYPGFFNDYTVTKDTPTPYYKPVISGMIMDEKKRRFSPSGWLALGYNEVGQLDGNFSCFTPIFIQHPVPKVFTKIGQAPTFRAQAVDYHTLPDDKINVRYPEIVYWAYKLKILSPNMHNLYPLKYKWFRVPKNKYLDFLASGDLSQAEFSNPTGEWACLEGDRNQCTLIHPNECSPQGVIGGAMGLTDAYTFVKGAKLGKDDQYYYMCMASGRFGVRMSEKSELNIEDFLRFDISFKNGMNAASPFNITFRVYDTGDKPSDVVFTPANVDSISNYMGYQQDPYAVPEAVIEQKVPPPNAGFGDVTAFRMVGPILYVGASRSWQPDTLMDTRGVRGAWGRFIEYGALVAFSKRLNQREGDLLYGYKHLPECDSYQMPAGKKGIQVIGQFAGSTMSHWTLTQQAVAATNSKVGMAWDKIGHVGQLYPPMTRLVYAPDQNGNVTWAVPGSDPLNGGYGIGHWQWGNNLGAIKRFGYVSKLEDDDIRFLGNGRVPSLDEVKKKLIKSDTLAGKNCGYTPLGLGRNMVYYIEAFGRFYLMCDLLKKKNVKNLSFMCPGLRATNSAIQYFWMGHPSNTYVERRPMYGPYAYQWRVRRHNRDRNGNGISEGFYSMGYDMPYSLMYDAPAIFGLYVKPAGFATAGYKGMVNQINDARKAAGLDGDIFSLRNKWFGVGGSEGTSSYYGDYFCPRDGSGPLCDYIGNAQSLATSPDFKAYGCDGLALYNGGCFDPCMSIRYGQGFFPGGKAQDMFGTYGDTINNYAAKSIRLVPTANLDKHGAVIYSDEPSAIDRTILFRAPVNTPHARIIRGVQTVNNYMYPPQDVMGVSPCRDGGSDHCNYLTPTAHLKTSTILMKDVNSYTAAANYASNIYASYNIRGDES